MANFECSVGFLDVKVHQLAKLFDFDHEACKGLNRESFQNEICKEFLNQFGVTVNIQWGNDRSRKSIIIDLYCALKSCHRRFKIKILKNDILKGKEVKLKVLSTHHECNHDEQVIRQLRANDRREIASKAAASSVSKVRSEALNESRKELLKKGHLQQVYTEPVIRQAVSELKSKNDTHKNQLHDLLLKSDKMKFVHNIEYKCERFNITILSNDQIRMLACYRRKCKELKVISRMCYDATGGMCVSPNENIKRLFHHTLVISMKFNEIDTKNSLINIGEMVSSLHTTFQQEIFLRRFIELSSAHIKDSGKNLHLL